MMIFIKDYKKKLKIYLSYLPGPDYTLLYVTGISAACSSDELADN